MTRPSSLQRLFYRYHADHLDTDRRAAILIPTVLADGSLDDWDWLFLVYDWETIRAWVADPLHSQTLPPPLERFCTLVLLSDPRETPRWEDGNRQRRVPTDALPPWFPVEWR